MLVCPTCGSNYTREQEHCGLDGTKLVRSDADPLIGRTIDKYRIEARLGSGGMATVYRARHEFLDKDYAIKVLHGQIAADSTMSRRFQREAKTLGQIKHPNVVSVDNFGATTAGLLYMVMEHIDGFTLSQTLRKQGPFAPGRAADIVRQIATGLQAAHRKGFVHRDLKPGNVMLMDDEIEGELVKLMDFGLVSIVSPDENHTQLTQDGQFFGTPMYMAPEQITGHPVTPATDLYALGVILHQMLSGEPPFTGDVKKLAFQHVQTDPPTLDSSYGGLADLSRTLMAKSVEDRPADAAEVISAIDTLALTPVSHPVQMPRSDSSAEPLGPEFAATIPYGSSDDDEAPLSRPILQEERAFRTAHEADAVLIDEALGQRSRRTPMLLFVLFLVAGGAVSLYYANGERFELDALQRLLPVPNQAPGASAPGEIRSTQPDEDSRNAPSAGSKDGDKDGANATGAGAAADRTNAEKNGAATDGANGAKAGTAATGGAGATAAKTGAAANSAAAASARGRQDQRCGRQDGRRGRQDGRRGRQDGRCYAPRRDGAKRRRHRAQGCPRRQQCCPCHRGQQCTGRRPSAPGPATGQRADRPRPPENFRRARRPFKRSAQ